MERVKLLVEERLKGNHKICGPVNLVKFELSDSWTRDSGPSFVLNKLHELRELIGTSMPTEASLQEDGSPVQIPNSTMTKLWQNGF